MDVEFKVEMRIGETDPELDRRHSWAWLPPFATLRRFRRGALLVCAGAPAEAVHVIRAGQVRIYLPRQRGDQVQEVTTALLGPGQLVGISALLGRPTYQAYAKALTPVEAWEMDGARLCQHLAHQPALQEVVLRAICRELAQSEALVRYIALHPVAQRLCAVSMLLQPALGGAIPQLNRRQLARLIGARRETVSRAVGGGNRVRTATGGAPAPPAPSALPVAAAA